jgi:hypothetical protein
MNLLDIIVERSFGAVGRRPALIILSHRDAEEVATAAHVSGLFPSWRALAGMNVNGVPIAVAEVEDSITVEYDLTMRHIR